MVYIYIWHKYIIKNTPKTSKHLFTWLQNIWKFTWWLIDCVPATSCWVLLTGLFIGFLECIRVSNWLYNVQLQYNCGIFHTHTHKSFFQIVVMPTFQLGCTSKKNGAGYIAINTWCSVTVHFLCPKLPWYFLGSLLGSSQHSHADHYPHGTKFQSMPAMWTSKWPKLRDDASVALKLYGTPRWTTLLS